MRFFKLSVILSTVVLTSLSLYTLVYYFIVVKIWPGFVSMNVLGLFLVSSGIGLILGLTRDYLICEVNHSELKNMVPESLVVVLVEVLGSVVCRQTTCTGVLAWFSGVTIIIAAGWLYLIEFPFTVYAAMRVMYAKSLRRAWREC